MLRRGMVRRTCFGVVERDSEHISCYSSIGTLLLVGSRQYFIFGLQANLQFVERVTE